MYLKFILGLICGLIFIINNHPVNSFQRFFRRRFFREFKNEKTYLKSNKITEEYFLQKLDHFNATSSITWKQVFI